MVALPACGGGGGQGAATTPTVGTLASARLNVYAVSLADGSHQVFVEPTNVTVNGSNVSLSYGAAPISLTNVVSVTHTMSLAQTVARVTARNVAGSTGCVGGEEFNWNYNATDYAESYNASTNSSGFLLTYTVPASDYHLYLTQAVDVTFNYFPPSGGEDAESVPASFAGTDETDGAYSTNTAYTLPGEFPAFPYDEIAISVEGTTPSGGSTDWTAEGNQEGCRTL
jgi:hypothetical protein